jgi:hypothetical protein
VEGWRVMGVLGREGRDWEKGRGEGFLGGARIGAESEAEGAAMDCECGQFVYISTTQ